VDVDRPDPRPGRADRWRTIARTLGELLVTGGFVVLLFGVYEVYVTDCSPTAVRTT
jgi:sortase A